MKINRIDRWILRIFKVKVVDLPDGEIRLILDFRPPSWFLERVKEKGYRLIESGGWYTIEKRQEQ